MAKRIKGVKYIKDDTYLVDYQVGHRRFQSRIRANSPAEAKHRREELIVELRRQLPESESENGRLNSGFDEAWQKLEADLRSDGLCPKNLQRNRKVFRRVFEDFKVKKFPHIKAVSQVTLPFLQEYKAYFINELGYDPRGGLRAELIVLKAMLRRFRRLGLCGKEIIEMLLEIKRPKGKKKNYPDIPSGKIRQLLDFIRNDRPDFYGVLYYVARLGRRIGEATLIERRDVAWNGLRPVRINVRPETTKTKEDTPIERIDDDLAQVIQNAYRIGSARKTVYLFCNKWGRKCAQGTLQKYLRRVSKQLVGVELTPHYFRHRFLTECGKANVSMTDVMHIAGIRDAKVVKDYYQHATIDGQDKVLAVTAGL